MPPEGFVRAARLDELPPGSLLGVEVNGVKVCLVHTADDGGIYALRDNCSHQDFPLSLGALEDGVVECHWHGARFDVETGRALALPAIRPVKTYEVRVEDGAVWIAV